MPNETDERIAQEQAQNHPPSWASLYGEQGMEVPVYGDPGPSWDPDERSSAARHARGVKVREQAASERRDLVVIAHAADEASDELALKRALQLLQDGQPIPVAMRLRAARAASRNGTTIPTASQHAAKALRNRQGS